MYVHINNRFWHDLFKNSVMSKMKLYGIEGNSTTEEVRKYLTMMRENFQFIDIREHEDLKRLFANKSGGDLKLVWVEENNELTLINSPAMMCNYLNNKN